MNELEQQVQGHTTIDKILDKNKYEKIRCYRRFIFQCMCILCVSIYHNHHTTCLKPVEILGS